MTEPALTSSGSLTAEVEVSDDRLARRVVVRRDGKVEHDSLFVQGSRIRPEFYPSDLPFFAGETVHISPKGAFWLRTSPSVEDRVAKIHESVREMMTDPRMAGFMSIVERIAGTAGDSPRRAVDELKKAVPALSEDVTDTLLSPPEPRTISSRDCSSIIAMRDGISSLTRPAPPPAELRSRHAAMNAGSSP